MRFLDTLWTRVRYLAREKPCFYEGENQTAIEIRGKPWSGDVESLPGWAEFEREDTCR